MRLLSNLITCILILMPASPGWADQPLRILVMGDSLMTTNASAGSAIPQLLAERLGAQVKSRAISGARFGYKLPVTGALGMSISKQWRPGRWDAVVMNGGGNDLWLGCGCRRCYRRLNRLISQDGRTGLIPQSVSRARSAGVPVIYVGYLRSPGVGSPIERCKVWGDRLEARIARMATADAGIRFVSLTDMIPYGDRSFHALDMIHPSPKGSRAVADRITRALTSLP